MVKDNYFPNVGFVCQAFLYSVRFLVSHYIGIYLVYYICIHQLSELAKTLLTHDSCCSWGRVLNNKTCNLKEGGGR